LASVGTIQLAEGRLLQVRLNDASSVLKADEDARVPGAQVLAGVWTPTGLFVPLRVRTRGSVSRVLEVPVPIGQQVNLTVSSKRFSLSDEGNRPVDATQGSRRTVQATVGSAPIVHTLNVTGRTAATGRP
jgi:hypothetical protein